MESCVFLLVVVVVVVVVVAPFLPPAVPQRFPSTFAYLSHARYDAVQVLFFSTSARIDYLVAQLFFYFFIFLFLTSELGPIKRGSPGL